MTKRQKIDDVGDYLPYARKHEVQHGGFNFSNSNFSLKDIWPEPDWIQMISSGLNPYVAARLAVIYKGIRSKPKSQTYYWPVTTEQWKYGYIELVLILQDVFKEIRTMEDVDNLEKTIALKLGFGSVEDMRNADISENYAFYSLSKGDRVLRSVTSTPLKNIAPYLPDFGWPESDVALKLGRFPLRFTDGTWGACWRSGKSVRYNSSEVFGTEEEAIEFIKWLISREEKVEKEEKPKEKLPTKPSCTNVARSGGVDYRLGDFPAEYLLEDFSFRGIQFGASMNEKEKQRWINNVYDGLSDLAEVLDIPTKWIGLKSNDFEGIGIAFGARGRSAALAHYESDLRIVNLTRLKGASSLAHEWGHALDHKLGDDISAFSSPFASEVVGRGLFNNESSTIAPVIDSMKRLMAYINSADTEFYCRSKRVNNIYRSGGYWLRRRELFARCFESFVQDQLLEKGIVSPWLVHGTRPEDYKAFKEETFPYPLGKDRQRINDLFLEFFPLISNIRKSRS